jgi:DNA-binding LacI/PurR family transcriptional regulator
MARFRTVKPRIFQNKPMASYGIHSHRAEQAMQRMMVSGAFAAGSPLPAERELAVMLQVGRVAVRRAVARLEEEGWLQRVSSYRRVVVGEPRLVSKIEPETPESTSFRPYRSLTNTICILERVLHVRGGKQAPGWIDWIPAGMAERSRALKFDVIALDPTAADDDLIDRVVHERPLGLLIPETPVIAGYETLRDRLMARLNAAGIPVVICGDAPGMERFDRVVTDHAHGWLLATRWLLGRGCKKPLAVLLAEGWWLEHRLVGYRKALREARLEVPRLVRMTNLSFAGDPAAPDHDLSLAYYFAGLLRERVAEADAFLMPSDPLVRPMQQALRLLGRDPAQVPVVGYDCVWQDLPDQLGHGDQPAISIDRRNREVGHAAVDLLLERVQGKLPSEVQRRLLAPKLVVPS